MGERNPRKTIDLILLQLEVTEGRMTTDEAVDAFMNKWYTDETQAAWDFVMNG